MRVRAQWAVRRLIVSCPAKVNLFLAVGRPDERGYHPIRTVFQAIGLFDELMVEEAPTPEFVCDSPEVPQENTVTHALRMLSEVAPLPPLRLTMTKRIPSQAGLGGGSSDAAGLLRAAKQLVPSIPKEDLHRVAMAVGMDVPFFLVGGRARGDGYGERLSPLPDAPQEWLVVARPNVGCATGEAYRALDAKAYEWRDFPPDDRLYNDFERVAPCESLDLIESLQALGARDAALSGSGSAVFGRFESQDEAESAAARMRAEKALSVWVAPTLTRAESLGDVPAELR